MNNDTPNNAPKQLSLFTPELENSIKDPRPLVIIIAETWNFPLMVIENDDPKENLYCARDWYMGLGGDRTRWSKSKSDWLAGGQPVMIEVKRERRKPEMLEFTGEKGLYDIAQAMKVTEKNEAALQPIKDYLSESGVIVDKERRDSAYAEKRIEGLQTHHGLREKSIEKRNAFTDTAKATHIHQLPEYARLTNVPYYHLFKTNSEKTAKAEIVAILGLDEKQGRKVRDYLNGLALSAVSMTEEAATAKMKAIGRLLTSDEQIEIARVCARRVAETARDLADYAGVDLLTGKPLLGSGE